MATTEIAKSNGSSLVTNLRDLQEIAQTFLKSGFFQDVTDLAKAQVKIMAGREIGLEPFASMTGIHVIKGKVTYGANVQAAKVKSSGRYDYRVREMSDKACRVAFYERIDGKWAEIGLSEFTIDDAKKAGTQNLDKFARNMLFARAISNGVKWFCPDVTSGVTMYAPEEFGAVVDDAGTIVEIDGKIIDIEPSPAAPQKSPAENSDAERVGFITPELCVELKLSENEFSARNMLKSLNIGQKWEAKNALPIIRKYRAARDAGKSSTEAAEAARPVLSNE